jgi:1-acyl-sn-glycerol-3-phosphate acyltransferase
VRVPSFHWWRTVFFLIPVIGAATIVFGTLSVVSSLFGGRGTFAHTCARLWSRWILLTTGVRVTSRGLDLVERGRPHVFVANHQSMYDIPVVFWHLPFDVRIIAKEELGRFPFIGWHLSRSGHVLVRRDKPGGAVFQQVSEMMQAGRSLIVFPEGTRSLDGRVGKFRSGVFRLAIEAGLDIVPVAIRGTHAVMRKKYLTARPGRVSIEVFAPIPVAGLVTEDAKALAERVERIVTDGVGDNTALGALPDAR